jgi:hypothetical protein
MRRQLHRILTIAMAGSLALAACDAASARSKKKSRGKPQATTSESWLRTADPGRLVPMDSSGTPIIMQGYKTPAMRRGEQGVDEPRQRADRPVKIPRGSSTYIPPPNPSPYSVNSPPAPALTQPTVQPYNPPPITTFSDRVNGAIQAYPLERGIGNNPLDQQQFIRQRLNQ